MRTSHRAALAGLCMAWLGIAAFAPPPPMLGYELDSLTGVAGGSAALASLQPVEPGEQYPPDERDRATSPRVPPPRPRPATDKWRLSIDASIVGDSNVTNATDRESVTIDPGGGPLPIELDPAQRERSGIGYGISARGGLRLPVSPRAALTLEGEGHFLNYPGVRSDDGSLLVAAGTELGWKSGASASVELIAVQRWYGGVSASRGAGVRGEYRQPVGKGRTLGLQLDARRFDSDYGEAFEGTRASAYLTYEAALNPGLSASAGLYARREWLGSKSWSSLELGGYGGVNHYLSDTLSGGVSAGIGRILFDAPVAFLSPDPREDWRVYGSAYLSSRKSLFGFYPSLTYSYNRSASSIQYYDSDRHRLRLGVSRKF
jgi:hypothetical protein